MICKQRTTVVRRLAILIICATLSFTLSGRTRVGAEASDIAPEAILFSENFNSVTVPVLPNGWTTSQTGSNASFTTVAANGTNTSISAFTNSPATAGSAELVSPPIPIGTEPTRISFRHRFVTEPTPGFDGGVLEISIGGGAYQDIAAAGGIFLTGDYIQPIFAEATGNPLVGRRAWTGSVPDYITSVVTLPTSASSQSVRFKWRYGTDEIVSGQGWWVDDIQLITNPVTTGIVYTFSSGGAISIPDSGQANPYPSTINVSNLPTQIAKVTVRLNALSHTNPADMDIMLVGPQGQTAVIMSDVGSTFDLSAVNITLDDEAILSVPLNSAIVGGTYIPTNSGVGDGFPAPAPAQTGASALSVFSGSNPNGAWRLFVVDDAGGNSGSIGAGWTLSITAAISGQNANSISIPESGVASPYPSEITIADHFDPISRIQVSLFGFSHTSADDVDILLVSPSGRAVTLMSDAGGANAMTNLNLSFDDAASAGLPDDLPIAAGLYKPTDYEPGDTFPAPAAAPTGRTLSSLNGTSGNGVWKLFIVDDAGNNVGTISGGWTLLVGTAPGTVTVSGSTAASPYPSEISVSGLPGSITKATVAIQNFSHIAPDDVDIMLVGPDGRRIVLMSDAGGQNEVGALSLNFDDLAPGPVPDEGTITNAVYRPTDYEPGDVFPAPAPGGPPTGNTLGAFYGGAPNGIWRLYVVGDGGATFGSLGGNWSMTLQTSTSACLHQVSPTVQAFPVGGGSGSFNVTQPAGCGWTASTTDSFITITSGSSGGGNGAVGFSVAANQGPARTGTIEVTNGVITRSFQVQQPSGCPLSLSQSTVNFAGTGGTGSINVSAGGACSWQGFTLATWIQITSAPQSGNGTLTFGVQPNTTGLPRSALVEIGSLIVNVNQAPSRATPFDFDGDSRTDVSAYRPSTGTWWIAPSNQPGTASAQQFGIASDRIAPADFDGDLKTDVAVYRDGVWYFYRSSNGTVGVVPWGTTGDIPVPANYTGDSSAELAVFRPSTGTWWILNSNGTFISQAFGIPTDIPTPGDYDGDGRIDISVFRPAPTASDAGTWWIMNSSNGVVGSTSFGVQGDIPVAGDYDGDGRDGVAVYRPSTGWWFRSTDPTRNYDAVQWGIPGDDPIAGDYDGDGKSDPAVVRPGSSAVWYMLRSTSGAAAVAFGTTNDQPAPGAYIQ